MESGSSNRIRIENPFTLKVGQVFTGFGIGCGIGIGVGRPLNLGTPFSSSHTMDLGRFFKPKIGHAHTQTSPNNPCAIPVLDQVMSATRGATTAFSGVSRHVNTSLRKLGAKNIEAGIGCGVGFGHGFGVGLAVKPGVLNQIQSSFVVAMTKMMMKLGITPNLPFGQGALPASLQSGLGTVNPNQISAGSMMQLATKGADQVSQGLAGSQPLKIGSAFENTALRGKVTDSTYGSRTEKVLNNFLQTPLLKGEGEGQDQVGGHLRSENNLLHMVLKHQQIIEQLMEENEKLRQILVEDLKIPSSKLQASSSGRNKLPCTDCFDCRRKQRKK